MAASEEAGGVDRFAIPGKFAPPEMRAEIVVIGAGPTGVAAAIEAASGGAHVLLIDENPVSAAMMGLDAPLYFGQRATAATQNRARMLEQVISATPMLEAAIENGVDVMLGVCAWGAYVNGPALQALPEPVVGLADAERSFMCGFRALILAAGARDIALSFPGWDQPGVMGANALHALVTRYEAFAGRRICVLGSGALGLTTALLAHDRGLDVVGVVEAREIVQGPAGLCARLTASAIPVYAGHRLLEAQRGPGGVAGVKLRAPDGRDVSLACDTVVVAVGLAPSIELADVVGARLAMRVDRGGHVPVALDGVSLSTPGVFTAGDAAGVTGAGLMDAEIGRAHGRAAARAALALCGRSPGGHFAPFAPPGDHESAIAYQLDWTKSLLAAGDDSVIVCQCEEVTRADLFGLRPPRYLGPPPPAMARRALADLADHGQISQDQVKRLTRACMGPCQARRCREQIALLLSVAAGVDPASIALAGFRAPVRPLPLAVLADRAESATLSENWDVWFGIASQWIPYDEIDAARERSIGRED